MSSSGDHRASVRERGEQRMLSPEWKAALIKRCKQKLHQKRSAILRQLRRQQMAEEREAGAAGATVDAEARTAHSRHGVITQLIGSVWNGASGAPSGRPEDLRDDDLDPQLQADPGFASDDFEDLAGDNEAISILSALCGKDGAFDLEHSYESYDDEDDDDIDWSDDGVMGAAYDTSGSMSIVRHRRRRRVRRRAPPGMPPADFVEIYDALDRVILAELEALALDDTLNFDEELARASARGTYAVGDVALLCPICMQNRTFKHKAIIFCQCGMRLNLKDQVQLTLEQLDTLIRDRFQAHMAAGCDAMPVFRLDTFDEALGDFLVLSCDVCSAYDIIV